MRKLFAGALMMLAVIPTAQAMTVSEFLAKASVLKAKGVLAMGSPDISLLRNEVKGAADAYRSDIDVATKAGKPTHSCPPPKGKGSVSSDEMMAEFQSIPAAQRSRISVKDAFYAMMKKRYPCK